MPHWPWSSDPAVVEKLNTIIALMKKQHREEMDAMATFDEMMDAAETAQAEMEQRLSEYIEATAAEIAALKLLVEQGQVLSPAQEARLEALIQRDRALNPRLPDVLPG